MWLLFVLLSALCWALVNVLNSIVVRHYVTSPLVLTWIQSCMCIPLILVLGFTLDIRSTWTPMLIFFGLTAYAGDLWFFRVLGHLDVSILNIAWAIMALLLSLAGFLFFGESWTTAQSVGAALIVGGSLILSLYHRGTGSKNTFWLLFILALLYAPHYIVKNAAIKEGQSVGAVFFWMLLARDIISTGMPIFSPATGREAVKIFRSSWAFVLLCLASEIFYLLAEYLGALAYVSGPLSLVSIVGNVQPFLVIAIAGLCAVLWPRAAPRELLTRQSVSLKLLCFSIVFVGLALLAVSQ